MVVSLLLDILGLAVFVPMVILVFGIPGFVAISRWCKVKDFSLGFSTIVGMVLVTTLSFFLAYIQLRFVTGFVILLLNASFWYGWIRARSYSRVRFWLQSRWHDFRQIDTWVLIILTVGIVVHLSGNITFGLINQNGDMVFCCRGVPDYIYHTALTDELVDTLPPDEPGLSGVQVRNYHYWANLTTAELIRYSQLPLLSTMRFYMPVYILLLFAWALVQIPKLLGWGVVASRLFVFVTLFFGELTYFLRWITTGIFSFDLAFMDDAASLVAGPPRAFSIVVLYWAIYGLVKFVKMKRLGLIFMLALLFASLAGYKFYTFILAGMGLFGFGIYSLSKKNMPGILLPVLTLLAGLAIYMPVNMGSGNQLHFHEPYNAYNFIERPELGLTILRLRYNVFVEHNNSLKILLYMAGFIGLYLFTMYGLLVMAVFYFFQKLRLPTFYELFLLFSILGGLVLGLFTSQQFGGLNTTQFLMTVPYLLVFLVTPVLYSMLMKVKKKSVLWGIIACLVLFSGTPKIVRNFSQNINLIKGSETITVERPELEMYECLHDTNDSKKLMIYPGLADVQKSYYVPFLSQKEMYLAGLHSVLVDHGIDEGMDRFETNKFVYGHLNPPAAKSMLSKNDVGYLLARMEDTTVKKNASVSATLCKNKAWSVYIYE